MSALLWVLIVVAVLHLVSLVAGFYGGRAAGPRTPVIAGLDMAYTLTLGAWAVWLLAKGA